MDTGKRRTANLAPAGANVHGNEEHGSDHFPSESDCVASSPAGSPNICEGGAVAYALGIRVTAQVPLTQVGQLQPGASRLQQRSGGLVSAQTPGLTYFPPDKS